MVPNPPFLDERLSFTMPDCPGPHYLLGSAHTFPGRMLAWCPTKAKTFYVSRSDLLEESESASLWIAGFLAAAVPAPPGGDFDDPSWTAAEAEFRTTGTWTPPVDGDLERDAERARGVGLRFKVAVKSGLGEPWTTIQEGIEDLERALVMARESGEAEAGVWTDHGTGGGELLYWSTRAPDVLNSSILHPARDE